MHIPELTQLNLAVLREEGTVILELLSDLDTLLNTNKDFLLGAWLKQAEEAATTEQVTPAEIKRVL